MGYALLDRPNPNGRFYYPGRRARVKALVQHVTAGRQDYLMEGEDPTAEADARYACTNDRKVSWHDSVDSDGFIRILPATYTAWHCGSYNSKTIGQEIGKKDTDWRTAPDRWVAAVLRQSARAWLPHVKKYAIPLRHATRAELDRAIANDSAPVGFLGHYQLSPDTRHDPGEVGTLDTFPWKRLLDAIRVELGEGPSVIALPTPPAAIVADTVFPLPKGHFFGMDPERPDDPELWNGTESTQARAWVKVIQTSLGAEPDGIIGPLTDQAIKTMQRVHRLPAEGLLGPRTWPLLAAHEPVTG